MSPASIPSIKRALKKANEVQSLPMEIRFDFFNTGQCLATWGWYLGACLNHRLSQGVRNPEKTSNPQDCSTPHFTPLPHQLVLKLVSRQPLAPKVGTWSLTIPKKYTFPVYHLDVRFAKLVSGQRMKYNPLMTVSTSLKQEAYQRLISWFPTTY